MPDGWQGSPKVPADGTYWPLEFAAKTLGMPLKDLRELVRITGLPPAGTINMRGYRSQGRIPRAYSAKKLIELQEGIRVLSERLRRLPGTSRVVPGFVFLSFQLTVLDIMWLNHIKLVSRIVMSWHHARPAVLPDPEDS